MEPRANDCSDTKECLRSLAAGPKGCQESSQESGGSMASSSSDESDHPQDDAAQDDGAPQDQKQNQQQKDLEDKRAYNRRNSARYRKRVKDQISSLIDQLEEKKTKVAKLEKTVDRLTKENAKLTSQVDIFKAQANTPSGASLAAFATGAGLPLRPSLSHEAEAQYALLASQAGFSGLGEAMLAPAASSQQLGGAEQKQDEPDNAYGVGALLALAQQQQLSTMPPVARGFSDAANSALQQQQSGSSSVGLPRHPWLAGVNPVTLHALEEQAQEDQKRAVLLSLLASLEEGKRRGW